MFEEADEALSSCATRVPPYDVLLLGLLLVHYDKKPLLAGELPLRLGLMGCPPRIELSFGGRLGAFFKAGGKIVWLSADGTIGAIDSGDCGCKDNSTRCCAWCELLMICVDAGYQEGVCMR